MATPKKAAPIKKAATKKAASKSGKKPAAKKKQVPKAEADLNKILKKSGLTVAMINAELDNLDSQMEGMGGGSAEAATGTIGPRMAFSFCTSWAKFKPILPALSLIALAFRQQKWSDAIAKIEIAADAACASSPTQQIKSTPEFAEAQGQAQPEAPATTTLGE